MIGARRAESARNADSARRTTNRIRRRRAESAFSADSARRANLAVSGVFSWGRLDEKSRFPQRENGRGWLFFKNTFFGWERCD